MSEWYIINSFEQSRTNENLRGADTMKSAYQTKRTWSLFICLMMCMAYLMTVPSLATNTGPKSLDDLANGNTTQSQAPATPAPTQAPQTQQGTSGSTGTSGTTGTDTQAQAKDFLGSLQDASKMDVSGSEVNSITQPIVKYSGMIVQVLSLIAVVGMSIRVAIDLIYIVVPFSRKFLANGHMGNPQTGQPMGQPGMGGPMGGGMMGGGMMGGGMGMGMGGMGRYGGGMGMGGMGMGGPMAGGMNAQGDMGSRMNRVQWVSGAALNAVAAESTVGPDGKAVSPVKEYMKDMIVLFVLVPILVILLATGAIQAVGFAVGRGISSMIGGAL